MSADLNQRDQILRTLKRGKTLTPMGALSDFGCFRLAARGGVNSVAHPLRGPGSRPTDGAPSGLHASRFDPLRGEG